MQYTVAVQKVSEWMASVHMWTSVFLFSLGVYFDQDLRESMSLPSNST